MGWLESFRKRHEISFKAVCGEAGDDLDETVNMWIKKIEGYEPQNIANADESGIFFVADQLNLYVLKKQSVPVVNSQKNVSRCSFVPL
ncbi:hypothetical protein AVEN_78658-1 [Araneus ventricosus]|uniref:HTH CENPB-type domain-containing protein n=1 Tax=Araneus ventricosus TaxID=182803 RepID=A0A4Y2N6S2_ARAVE|nr:hypothetical protein AVEN_42155-1 [Araneus ventricosus]GBN33533.1 hypothetical protein AVEN_78658-1 [Araneus ventricosus]